MNEQAEKGPLKNLNTVIKYFVASLMMIITALTFYQVVLRYLFNSAPSWSEEMVRFLFIWSSFVAAAIGIREGIHIGIDVFVNLAPRRIARFIEIIVSLVIMVFGAYMIYYGWLVARMTHSQPSPALGLPMSWVYLSIPVMGVLLIVYCSSEIAKTYRKINLERGH
jgi:TRAP-type C4-dicarboxylate transport system permease small subunit